MTTLPPPTLQQNTALKAQIEKRRAMAKALAAVQMPQGQMAGRFFAAPSPWAQLAVGAANTYGQIQGAKADSMQSDLDSDNRRKMSEALATAGTKRGMSPEEIQGLEALSDENQGKLLGEIQADRIIPKREKVGDGDVLLEDGVPKYIAPRAPAPAQPNDRVKDAKGVWRYATREGAVGQEAPPPDADGGTGQYNPRDYTAESWAPFVTEGDPNYGNPAILRRYSAPVVRNVAGVETSITQGPEVKQQPLSTLPAVASAEKQIKEAGAEGTAIGTDRGKAIGETMRRGVKAKDVLRKLEMADSYLNDATGSGIGSLVDKGAGFVGHATEGAKATGELQVLGADLVLTLPRLEGPQSNQDTDLYKQASARIGDDTVPIEIRRAALRTIRRVQSEYKDQFDAWWAQQPQSSQPGAAPPGAFPGAAPGAAPAAGDAPASAPAEVSITNQATGEKMILRDGQWQPVK